MRKWWQGLLRVSPDITRQDEIAAQLDALEKPHRDALAHTALAYRAAALVMLNTVNEYIPFRDACVAAGLERQGWARPVIYVIVRPHEEYT